jgi:hypothetical protein
MPYCLPPFPYFKKTNTTTQLLPCTVIFTLRLKSTGRGFICPIKALAHRQKLQKYFTYYFKNNSLKILQKMAQ